MAVFTVKDLKTLIAEGKKQNYLLATRIDAAALIYLTRQILPEHKEDGTPYYKVESESESNVFYEVVDKSCTCTDFTRKRAVSGYCKHRLAILIVERAKELIEKREENERKAGVRIFEES